MDSLLQFRDKDGDPIAFNPVHVVMIAVDTNFVPPHTNVLVAAPGVVNMYHILESHAEAMAIWEKVRGSGDSGESTDSGGEVRPGSE